MTRKQIENKFDIIIEGRRGNYVAHPIGDERWPFAASSLSDVEEHYQEMQDEYDSIMNLA